jgi:hypothetical protein
MKAFKSEQEVVNYFRELAEKSDAWLGEPWP